MFGELSYKASCKHKPLGQGLLPEYELSLEQKRMLPRLIALLICHSKPVRMTQPCTGAFTPIQGNSILKVFIIGLSIMFAQEGLTKDENTAPMKTCVFKK